MRGQGGEKLRFGVEIPPEFEPKTEFPNTRFCCGYPGQKQVFTFAQFWCTWPHGGFRRAPEEDVRVGVIPHREQILAKLPPPVAGIPVRFAEAAY